MLGVVCCRIVVLMTAVAVIRLRSADTSCIPTTAAATAAAAATTTTTGDIAHLQLACRSGSSYLPLRLSRRTASHKCIVKGRRQCGLGGATREHGTVRRHAEGARRAASSDVTVPAAISTTSTCARTSAHARATAWGGYGLGVDRVVGVVVLRVV